MPRLDDFDASQPPRAGDRQHPPSGDRYLMEDFFYAGGLPALMNASEAPAPGMAR